MRVEKTQHAEFAYRRKLRARSRLEIRMFGIR